MSLNRLRYDTNSYKHSLAESVGPFEYQLGTPLRCDECFVGDPNIRLQRSGVSTDKKNLMVDVDSELLNITRKLSKDPAKKYMPKEDTNGNLCTETKKSHPQNCDNTKTEYTLLSNPACNLRGTGWNRWEWLCQDPQENIVLPYYIGTDSKQLAKDQHRPCIPIQFQELGLPVPSNEAESEELEVVDAVPTGPMSTSWQTLNTIKKY